MDKIHDKANKLFNDVRGKKLLVGKNSRCDNTDKAKPDLSLNSCFYCQKVFVNSQFLMKHILRRHSDDLISLHKNCVKHESNNNSNDYRYLMSFLEKEFLTLKNELFSFKQGVLDKNETGEDFKVNHFTEVQEHVSYVGESSRKIDVSCVNEDNLNELKTVKESISCIEGNLESLQCKFEDIDKMLKNDVLLKDDMFEHMAYIDEKIQRTLEIQSTELREIILKDLKTVLSKQLHENNCKWKSWLSEVKDDIVRLDEIAANITKQINSPDSLKEIEKRLESQITYFLSNKSHRNSKKKHLRHKVQSAGASGKEVKHLRYKTELSGAKTSSSYRKNTDIKHVNEKASLVAHKEKFTNHITPNELLFLVAEKFSELCIEPNTSKLSLAEHEEKLKLLNSDKERLMSIFPNFSEIYDSINRRANHRVHSKLKHRHHKIRFSDPLTVDRKSTESNRYAASSLAMGGGPVPEISPFLHDGNDELNKIKNQLISESKNDQFPAPKEKSFLTIKNRRNPNFDMGASGDFSFKFSNSPDTSMNQMQLVDAHEFKPPSPVSKSLVSETSSSLPNHDKLSDISKSQSTSGRMHGKLTTSKSKPHLIANKQRFPYTDSGAGGDFPAKFSKKPDSTSIYQMQSIDEEFKTSSPVSKTDNLNKLRVTFSDECSVINPVISFSSEMQNYASTEVKNLNTAKTNDKTPFYIPVQRTGVKEDDILKIVENDSDVSELESLSSWEDGDDN